MLAKSPLFMEAREKDEVRIIPLKADVVMCEMTCCDRSARFLVKYKSGALSADCGKHADAIARSSQDSVDSN